jgi:hypothetical protein
MTATERLVYIYTINNGHSLTAAEAHAEIGGSLAAIRMAYRSLAKRGWVVPVRHGDYATAYYMPWRVPECIVVEPEPMTTRDAASLSAFVRGGDWEEAYFMLVYPQRMYTWAAKRERQRKQQEEPSGPSIFAYMDDPEAEQAQEGGAA